MQNWKIYLAGEIHSNWRDELREAAAAAEVPVSFFEPVTDHPASDDCGAVILGEESSAFWRDHKGAGLNAIRTRPLIASADIVVVKFGEKYRQWNAAFDAGQAIALGKPLIVLHPREFDHALKEIDAAASAVAENVGQVLEILRYVTKGTLQR